LVAANFSERDESTGGEKTAHIPPSPNKNPYLAGRAVGVPVVDDLVREHRDPLHDKIKEPEQGGGEKNNSKTNSMLLALLPHFAREEYRAKERLVFL